MGKPLKARSWFFCPTTAALFMGWAGDEYPESYELEQVPEWVQSDTTLRNLADDVVMRLIAPYVVDKGGTLDLKSGITIHYKETF